MIRIVALTALLALVSGNASAQSPAKFTVLHEVKFTPGTVLEHKQLSAVPLLRDLVAEPFLIAREDLNDDGAREIILMATTSANCGSGGCLTMVAENRAGQISAILDQNLFSSLAVTNEKIGQYRALAAVGDKGTILFGEKQGTPLFGKQMVYPMTVTQSPMAAARPAVPASVQPPSAQAASVCGSRQHCAEVPTFVAIVSDFRISNAGRRRVITVTVRFANRTNRTLVLGYLHDSGVVVDDQGNRYTVSAPSAVRGIGEIVGDTLDPKFALAAGESGDARIEFAFDPGRQVLGTNYEIDAAFREINAVSGNQWQLGREHALHFSGFTDAGIVAATGPGAASQPAVAQPVPTAPGSASPDRCGRAPRCYDAGPFVANITQVTITRDTDASAIHSGAKVTMRIRNVSTRGIALGYRGRSGQLTDDAGNRYGNETAAVRSRVSGIGTISGDDVDPRFVLGPGEARDATFDNTLSINRSKALGTVFNYDLTLEELEVLPSKQVRTARSYAVGFHDFKGGATAEPKGVTSSVLPSPAADSCSGSPRCHNAGPFTATISQMATTVTTHPANIESLVKITMKIKNVSDRRLILAYRVRSEQLSDDAGNRYGDESTSFISRVSGIGLINNEEVGTGFVLNPGQEREATFDSYLSLRKTLPLGSVFNYDLTIEEVEILPSGQVRSAQVHAVGFHEFKRTRGESLLDVGRRVLAQ